MWRKMYNRTFVKLGDKDPDFLAGVADLTLEKCSQFNIKVKDVEGVLYQSVTSKIEKLCFHQDFH